jgi:hypothetical protein
MSCVNQIASVLTCYVCTLFCPLTMFMLYYICQSNSFCFDIFYCLHIFLHIVQSKQCLCCNTYVNQSFFFDILYCLHIVQSKQCLCCKTYVNPSFFFDILYCLHIVQSKQCLCCNTYVNQSFFSDILYCLHIVQSKQCLCCITYVNQTVSVLTFYIVFTYFCILFCSYY